MKNHEKYADEIMGYNGHNSYDFCEEFVKRYILEPNNVKCVDTPCVKCHMLQTIWLLEEYEEPKEPETDWSKVKVDTPILVRYDEKTEWVKRHFAKYENGLVYAWKDSCTSWTVLHDKEVTSWKYAKLAESEEDKE